MSPFYPFRGGGLPKGDNVTFFYRFFYSAASLTQQFCRLKVSGWTGLRFRLPAQALLIHSLKISAEKTLHFSLLLPSHYKSQCPFGAWFFLKLLISWWDRLSQCKLFVNCPNKEQLWRNFKAIIIQAIIGKDIETQLSYRQRLFLFEAVGAESDSEEERLEEPIVAKCTKYHRYSRVKQTHKTPCYASLD